MGNGPAAIDPVGQVLGDLADEHAALDALVAGLDTDGWRTPTAAAGWDVRDTIVHLAFFDEAAVLATSDAAAFQAHVAALVDGSQSPEQRAAGLDGPAVLAWWRECRAAMLQRLAALGADERVPWYGPSMGVRSFATARLMETWSHGTDVAEALGAELPVTDRLRHVAHLGVSTRGWSYAVRGRAAPDTPVRVELTGPHGDLWVWGPDSASEVVRGPALDFCLVVTQRLPVGSSRLEVIGDAANEWMSIAQAFAGGATLTDPVRAR